jgi:rhamnosyltransferase
VISIVIPVKNGGRELERCLEGIAAQQLDERVELVVIDSGSTDGSGALARGYGALVREIPTEEFGHGSARNLGASLAHGDVLVFTNQDAYPASERWLARLVAPLRADAQVAGVYGRQLAHLDARPPEVYFLDFLYGPEPRVQRVRGEGELSMQTTLFSTANGAMRRATWEAFPFPEDIVMSEDQDWSRRVLLAGHTIVYEPEAAVRHSHNYTMGRAFRRFFDSGVSAERAYLAGGRSSNRALRASALRYARGELAWLWRTGQTRWIPYTMLYESVKMTGLLLGAKQRYLPRRLKRRLSTVPSFWER